MNNNLFYCPNKDTYPPFKKGYYLEEYFLDRMSNNQFPLTQRKYIPALWTNFQIEPWFNSRKNEMQKSLDKWVVQNPSVHGYFTVVQYDDGPLLKLPENTVVYGACSGDKPIPLIYQDIDEKLEKIPQKKFAEKKILCSFVGNITANNALPNVRRVMFDTLGRNENFKLFNSGGWTPAVSKSNIEIFIETTVNSKFALAPRGYGRSSFRFFEIFKLGTIPVYLWNDVNWLPFQDVIDYSQLCIVLNISEINKLETILLSVNEEQYIKMLTYYNQIKHLFTVEGMTEQILGDLR